MSIRIKALGVALNVAVVISPCLASADVMRMEEKGFGDQIFARRVSRHSEARRGELLREEEGSPRKETARRLMLQPNYNQHQWPLQVMYMIHQDE